MPRATTKRSGYRRKNVKKESFNFSRPYTCTAALNDRFVEDAELAIDYGLAKSISSYVRDCVEKLLEHFKEFNDTNLDAFQIRSFHMGRDLKLKMDMLKDKKIFQSKSEMIRAACLMNSIYLHKEIEQIEKKKREEEFIKENELKEAAKRYTNYRVIDSDEILDFEDIEEVKSK